MSAAAEQSHSSVEQDGGNEGRVWDPSQAFDAALKATWGHKEHRISCYIRSLPGEMTDVSLWFKASFMKPFWPLTSFFSAWLPDASGPQGD